MANRLAVKLIKDIALLKNGKKRPTSKGSIPVYGGNGIMDYVNQHNDENAVIVGRVGAYCGCVYFCENKCWISDNAISLKAKEGTYGRFLYYLLKTLDLNHHHIGGAQPLMTQDIIGRIEVNVPSYDVQKRIADILSSLDAKIENNNKINAKLEEMAQALFKSWFIDFEPFKDGNFVESELGLIPEGWKVGSADSFYEINIGKTPPRKESQWFSDSKDNNNIWVSISDMGSCGMFISDSSEYLTQEAIKKHNVVLVPKETILLSFKLTVGRVAIADRTLTTNEAIARFLLPDVIYREYTYLALKNYNYGNLGSTSSIATAVNSKIIKGMKLLIPSDEVLSEFHKKVSSIFEQIRILQQENNNLSQTRDTLLPKLMSGEIEL